MDHVILKIKCNCNKSSFHVPSKPIHSKEDTRVIFKRILEREEAYVDTLYQTRVSDDYISGARSVLRRLNKVVVC